VERIEKVEFAGRQVDAFVLTRESEGACVKGGGRDRYRRTVWFALDAGAVVREQLEWIDGFHPTKSVVATLNSAAAPVQVAATPSVPQQTAPPAPVVAAPRDSEPPLLAVPETLSTESGTVEIVGQATDNDRIAQVLVDDRAVPFAADGGFRVLRQVPVGSMPVRIAAVDAVGNRREAVVTVQSVDRAAPTIEIDEVPPTTESRIEVTGFVSDRSALASVAVDGEPVQLADGAFVLRRTLPVGETALTVVAVDEWGNRGERTIRLVRLAPEVATPTPPPAPVLVDIAPSERRVALVMGNSSYETAPLPNPARDAQLMADALRARGFEVIELIDGSQRDMRLAIVDFGDLLEGGGVGLFFYAGHGMQVGGENFLIPVDAQISREAHVAAEGISINQVLARMDGAKNPLNIVILDACRNNPFARAFRSAASGLAQMLAPNGTYIAYATAPGDVANDGDVADNSPFTRAVVEAISKPGLSIEETFKEVRRSVQQETNGDQVPWTSSSLTGDFFFRPVALQTPEKR
jgi:hypothetical protein